MVIFFRQFDTRPRKAKLPGDEGASLDRKFTSGTSLDEDFLPFLKTRPQRIAVSMLQSYQAQAQRDADDPWV